MDEFFPSKIWMKYFKWVKKQKTKKNVGRFGMVLNLRPRFENLEKNEK
jgi:hypothetical protein